jgi:hypothetical protein
MHRTALTRRRRRRDLRNRSLQQRFRRLRNLPIRLSVDVADRRARSRRQILKSFSLKFIMPAIIAICTVCVQKKKKKYNFEFTFSNQKWNPLLNRLF